MAFYSKPSTLLEQPSSRLHIVVTEDMLSGIRVGRHVQTAALLGTAHSMHKIRNIYRVAEEQARKHEEATVRIGLWLDPDKAGEAARHKVETAFALFGATTLHIRSKKDPKRHSNREIREYLNE